MTILWILSQSRYKTCLIAILFSDFFYIHTGQSTTIKVIELAVSY